MTPTYRVIAGLTAALALALALVAPAGAASAKTCGTFTHGYHYEVSASGGVSCRSALRIVKSFIRSNASWKKHSIDDTTAGTYYTNRRYKGWRCAEGSGGGSCHRGKRTASYTNSN
jgi:hypothetical protein